MPCTYDDGPRSYSGVSQSEYNKLKDELDEATRMLCEITAVAPSGYIDNISGLRAWVTRHAKMDADRREREEREKEAKRRELKRKIAAAKKELDDLE